MAMTLFDHHQRLHDLEVTVCALADAVAANPAHRPLLAEVGQRLRARGLGGAADLLPGDRVSAVARQ